MQHGPTAITDFWTWWADYAPTAGELFDAGDPESMARFDADITPRIEAIHPELGWSTASPPDAEHGLVLSPRGAAGLRSTTERWLRQAPEDQGGWRFYPARQPQHGMFELSIELNEHTFDLSHLAVQATFKNRQGKFEIAVYHPDFLFIPEEDRMQLAALTVDWAFGEDDVSRWVGRLHAVEELPLDTLPPATLPAMVDAVPEWYRKPGWVSMNGTTPDGAPVSIGLLFPLRSVDFPLFDHHVLVEVPFAGQRPDRRTEKRLGKLGEQLAKLAGTDGALVATTEVASRRGLHFYVDAERAEQVVEKFETVLKDWKGARVLPSEDPGWSNVAGLTTLPSGSA